MAKLPIVTYNDPVLRKKGEEVQNDSEKIQQLIDDMFETMYNANGVGLAAPQIGESLRIFVMDADSILKDEGEKPFGPEVIINPEIIEKGEDTVEYEEGCLSIPDVRENVIRPDQISVKYLDRNFNEKMIQVRGWLSRVIQHEKDHLDGVLFIDYLGSFRKRLIKGKLKEIDNGTLPVDYPVVPKEVI
ncbi:MAG TPA: peptide deformylase [Balneolales bacterium]|nr:peptide deformylase [Balneolales bacterium]